MRCGAHLELEVRGCKEGRLLSFMYGSEFNDVSLFSTDPLPRAGHSGQVGEGEAFFTSLKLSTNVIDGNMTSVKKKDGTSRYTKRNT